jgi:putative photosynthetic complex assembly protein
MGHHHHALAPGERPFPLLPLVGAASLVIVSLLSVAWLQWFGKPSLPPAPPPQVVAERNLAFEDTAEGAVVVRDADSGVLVAEFPAGEQGFIRSTLRGLARTRRSHGAGAEVPFRLERRANGQLLLIDPVTDQAIDLWAFGHANAEVFFDFLPTGFTEPQAAASGTNTVAQEATRRETP